MADPVIASGIRAQVVLRGSSGLPEDRWITTWAFEREDAAPATPADEVEVADRLAEFYAVTPPGATQELGRWLSQNVSSSATIRTYRLGQAPPRQPTVHEFTVPASSGASWPAEVALCLSFYSLRNLPRQRGRIYFGPLRDVAGESSGGDVRPTAALRTALAAAATRLAAYPAPLTWGVLSQRNARIDTVTGGWVDNAFDIQRRRGLGSNARTVWGS